jgi:hypothetical protein
MVSGDFKEEFARKRVAVRVEADRREREQCVARRDLPAVNDALAIHDADDEARHVVFAVGIEAGHLGGLAAESTQLFSRQPRAMPSTTEAIDFGSECAGRNVVEKEERTRALHENVVNAVVDEIAPDSVVRVRLESDFEFRSDAVRRSDEHGRTQGGKRAIEHSAEAADLGERARVESSARHLFDPVNRRICRVDGNARVAVSDGFGHRK